MSVTQTISEKQVVRAQRAADQRHNYTCSTSTLWGSPCVYVTKHKQGVPVVCYTVRFRTAGVPVCNCKDGQRHKGTALLCKHSCLAVVHLRDEQAAAPAEEPIPATISDEEWEAWQEAWEKEEEVRNWEAGRCHWCCCEPCTCPADYEAPSETEMTFSVIGGEWVQTAGPGLPDETESTYPLSPARIAQAMADRARLWN